MSLYLYPNRNTKWSCNEVSVGIYSTITNVASD